MISRRFLSFVKVLVLIIIAGIVLVQLDPSNMAIVQAMLIGAFFAGGTHITRKLLFPALDLQAIARKATEENNLGAAIVFAAVILFLVAVLFAAAGILR